jgi:hypothetical protein
LFNPRARNRPRKIVDFSEHLRMTADQLVRAHWVASFTGNSIKSDHTLLWPLRVTSM